ncbi:protein Spindly [Aplysia californica]|uniref:Protein Spindly n=1 Tax=Aplysia californica TaxID=6500 RepID=A0ABM1A1I8_APLCA|nr:protein Spindly [Aplysia californica]
MDSPNTSLNAGGSKVARDLEKKTQDLYVAHSTIETLNANIQHAESENAELKVALAEETKRRHEAEEAQQSRNALVTANRELVQGLQEDLEEAHARERAAQEMVVSLEGQVRQLSDRVAMVTQSSSDRSLLLEEEARNSEIQEQVARLTVEKESLQSRLLEAAQELEKKMSENSQLQYELREKEEELECCEAQFVSQCNITERLREQLQELRVQIESEAGQVDTDRKGNSLFAEVEDRRVMAERKTVQTETLLSKTEEKLIKSEKENKRLKKEMMLARQASAGFDHGVVKDLQSQLMKSKKAVIELSEKLNEKTSSSRPKHVPEPSCPSLGSCTDEDKFFINYLQVVISDKDREMKELQSTASREHMEKLHTDLLLTQARHEASALQQERNRLRCVTSTLEAEIRSLQRKYEPDQVSPMSPGDVGNKLQRALPLSEKTPANVDNTVRTEEKSHPPTKQHPTSSLKKENDPLSMIAHVLSGGGQGSADRVKGMRWSSTVDTLAADGEKSTAEMKVDDSKTGRRRPKRTGVQPGAGKYKSVTYCEASDEGASECKQQ